MKSEEIKIQIDTIKKEIQQKVGELTAAQNQYIIALENEYPIKKGQKVSVINSTKTEVGIFGGFSYKYGEAEPLVFVPKKDGSPSNRRIFLYYGAKIEAVK